MSLLIRLHEELLKDNHQSSLYHVQHLNHKVSPSVTYEPPGGAFLFFTSCATRSKPPNRAALETKVRTGSGKIGGC